MAKKIKCPHCGADLKEVGFYTDEDALVRTDWYFDGETFSVSDSERIDTGQDEIIEAHCKNCDGDITEFVKKNNLI